MRDAMTGMHIENVNSLSLSLQQIQLSRMKFEQRTAIPSLDMLLMYCSQRYKDFSTQSSIWTLMKQKIDYKTGAAILNKRLLIHHACTFRINIFIFES